MEGNVVTPLQKDLVFRTDRKVPRVGVMLVGLGGNNGTTLTAGLLANKHNIQWRTKEGLHTPDFTGSMTQSSTVRLGVDATGSPVHIPFHSMLPMVHPCDLVVGGWDISKTNLKEAMHRAEVLDYDLQRQLDHHMEAIVPLPSIYYPDFIAANQSERVDNLLPAGLYE